MRDYRTRFINGLHHTKILPEHLYVTLPTIIGDNFHRIIRENYIQPMVEGILCNINMEVNHQELEEMLYVYRWF